MSGKSVNWTKEQKQVIESRGCNLLVSAAAGSGKTAVLVERIIRMVTEGEHPLDIDKLLVMTFTNAAAAEMRERIGAAIEKKLQEDPGNDHLQIQAALVHHAQITTIDSFCLSIIRNHFNVLDLDPSFRIGDEGELTLLKGDVMHELIEDYYQNGGAAYERFVETYVPGKSDAGIEDYIMQVYHFSQSHPYPERWFAQCRKELISTEESAFDFEARFPWMQFLIEDAKRQIQELKLQMEEALKLCEETEGLQVYKPMFSQDVENLIGISESENFEMLYERLSQITWSRLAAVRSKEVNPEVKTYVSGCRDRTKKAITKLRDAYCFESPEEMQEDMEKTSGTVSMLLELAEEFSRRYQEKKKERNLVDFNDLEHEALRVLIRTEDGKETYTEVADEFSRQFEEVLVDEYQDSNLVQETLIHAVSRERFGTYNVFMVGDVKQSIYKFRLARPELFLEKYHNYETYDQAEGLCRKIELHQNFRSREQVLTGINDIFYQIMTENLGNIRYTEDAALHPGAVFPDGEKTAGIPELLVMDTSGASLNEMSDDAADYTAKELEGKMIAARIREMTDPEQGLRIWDKKLNGTGGYRTAQYRDIVILLRSTAGWTENLLSILMNEGIPAYAESRMGYFNTIEVETILSLLAVIDNPMQDIPLAAVLKSPIVGLRDVELAKMTAFFKASADKGQDRGIYAAMQCCLEHPDREMLDDSLQNKLQKFKNQLVEFRRESAYLSIHELLYHIFERTGYYHYAAAMPAGETRRANLDMLVEKASAYEQTSYKGLFHFIRYIENLKKYNTDFGEASTTGEEDNTIRIMSIHKSKGLEFPIVFLAGTGKKFNRQDVYGKILIDPELGIGTDYLDLEHRVNTTTLKKNVLRRKMDLDNLGEELRVLYVALTRAKEQLVITGTSRTLEKTMEKYAKVPLADGQIPYTVLSSAGSYLDWILMSLGGRPVRISVKNVPVAEMVGEELERQVEIRYSKEQLLNFQTNQSYDREYQEWLNHRLQGTYPYEADINLHTKMSVSELKKQGQMTDETESVCMEGPLDLDWNVLLNKGETGQDGEIVQEKTGIEPISATGGAERGTSYHRVLELLAFHQLHSLDDVQMALDELRERHKISESVYGLVDAEEIWKFLQSDLGQRMSRAQEEGRLHKEQQFVMGIPAREMGAADSDELVIIQGIIDAYLEEDGQLVIIDYKTDRVWNPRILAEHYKCQLDYYERAVSQMTGKKVKEKVIYSLTMHRSIYL
ncbi:MAG: helicase-exonuclease AddAB subunit AddA [Brotaphodocola sp.]